MNEGEWKANHFADPDVRKAMRQLQDMRYDLQIQVEALTDYTAWIEATYPNIKAEYKAIQDLEEASRERSPLGFAQAQAKAEGSHVSYE